MINALEAPCQAPVSPWVPIMAGPLRLIYLQKSAEIPWNPQKKASSLSSLSWQQWRSSGGDFGNHADHAQAGPAVAKHCELASDGPTSDGLIWLDQCHEEHIFLGIIWDLMVEGRLDMLPVVPGKPGRKFRKRDMTIGTGLLIEIVCGMRWSLQRRKEAVKWINESVNHWIREAMSQWFEDSMNQRITNDSPMNQWIIE